MRILATSAPNQGHFYPMLPTLWALRCAGHEVLVGVPEDFAPIAAGSGLPVMAVSKGFRLGSLGSSASRQGPSTADLVEHLRDYYVPAATITARGILQLAEAWRPAMVISTGWEYAGPMAATRIGVPFVLHGWGLLASPALDAPIAEALKPLHRQWGLDRVREPWRVIDNCPRSLQWATPPATAIHSKYAAYNGSGVLPGWLLEPPARRRVVVTLGHVPIKANHDNVLGRTVKALREFDVEVVLAVGNQLDVENVELPHGTRVARGLPLTSLVENCSLVIHHGGAGSAMTATDAGVPQLGLPQMCVQYQHADRIAEVGAGIALHPAQASVEAIAKAVDRLLFDPEAPHVVKVLRSENAHAPAPPAVVANFTSAFRVR